MIIAWLPLITLGFTFLMKSLLYRTFENHLSNARGIIFCLLHVTSMLQAFKVGGFWALFHIVAIEGDEGGWWSLVINCLMNSFLEIVVNSGVAELMFRKAQQCVKHE